MISKKSIRWSWHLLLARAAVFGLIQVCEPGTATAQVLNQEVNQLLSFGCAALNPAFLGFDPNFGANLSALFALPGGPPGGAVTSGGGGAASVQGSAASILNRVLLQRLDETDEEEGQDHKRSSSMRFNPFGSLLSGFGRTSSVSSPFYAATTG